MSSLPHDYKSNWPNFNARQRTRPLRGLCKRVLERTGEGAGRQAIDLGAGAGIETRAMLERGFRVLALDPAETSPELIRAAAGELGGALEVSSASFEEVTELPAADLIYAGFSLPFCAPETFTKMWQLMLDSLNPGGFLAVNLLGERDAWHPNPEMTFIRQDFLDANLPGCELVYLFEEEGEGVSFAGPKYWHTFDLIAQKNS